MDVTSVGKNLSVGADPPVDGTAGFDVVFLVANDAQHVGEIFPTKVIRCPLDEDDPPSTVTIKKATECAQHVAYLMAPFSVSYEIWSKFNPPGRDMSLPFPKGGEPIEPKRVLVTCFEGFNRSLFIAGCALVFAGEQPSGKAAREHLQLVRGEQAFADQGLKDALDKFYPAEQRYR